MSAEAFIAPGMLSSTPHPESYAMLIVVFSIDPLGELGEDEIYFHCSKGINNPDISVDSCIVLGDVLVRSNPLFSDIPSLILLLSYSVTRRELHRISER